MIGKDDLVPHPIEVAFPDLACWRKGNTGIDYVHSFDSGIAGPHVMVNALTHGNEVCGAIVVAELLARNLRPRRGKLSLSFANVAAYQRFDPAHPDLARFIDEDFNRVWSAEALDSPRDSAELRRARAMRPLIDSVDLLLDLHSMHESCAPLIVSGPLDKGIAFARDIGFPTQIVADTGHSQGRRLRDYAGFGDVSSWKNALLIECGQHWEARAVTVAREVTARFLLQLGIVDQNKLQSWLPTIAPAQSLIRITHAVVAQSTDFRFTADFRGLESIPSKGTLIALDTGREIRTPYDNCVLIMPSLRQLLPGVTVLRFGQLEITAK